MELLTKTFFKRMTGFLEKYPQVHFEWTQNSEKKNLKIFKSDESGFDIEINCESYGIYPAVDGWHGAPWDITVMEPEDICDGCLEFIRSLLCSDSKLTIYYSNKKPYRWVLSYPFDGNIIDDETGLFFFNYFGRRTKSEFQNMVLPVREEKNNLKN